MPDPALLMVAFEFPPLGTVGVHRPARLARHLPEFGIAPVVITTDRESLPKWSARQLDETLVAALPQGLTIHRVACPRPDAPRSLQLRRLRHFLSGGEEIGRQWAPGLAATWDRVVAGARPAAVYVTAPPFSVMPIVVQLAQQSGLPVIADFRDAWSQWCHNANPTWFHYRAKLRNERAVVEGADAVIGVTRQLIDDLRRVHPHVDAAKFHVIPSGYESSVPVPREAGRRRAAADPFVIAYVGGFYYSPEMRASVMDPWWRKKPAHWPQYSPRQEDWLYRSPYFFFRALARFLDRRPDMRRRIRVRFAGEPHQWLEQQAAEFGVRDVVEQVGRLSHAECLEFESDADALLSTSMKVLGGRDYCVAGKTFEYIAAGRPILGIVTNGEQRDFLIASGAAVVADADDVEASADAIAQLVDQKFTPAVAPEFLERFRATEASRQLAGIVRSVASHRA